jgi:dsDNA-specific endonuclease/ATPase MutS2
MKVIGFTHETYHGKGVVAELTSEEMLLIWKGTPYGRETIAIGNNLDICQRFRRFIKTEEMVAESAKTAATLRAFADVLESVIQTAADSVTPKPAVDP